jgi:hypothetical protein
MGRIRLQMDKYYSNLPNQKQIYLLSGVTEPEVLLCATVARILPWMVVHPPWRGRVGAQRRGGVKTNERAF